MILHEMHKDLLLADICIVPPLEASEDMSATTSSQNWRLSWPYVCVFQHGSSCMTAAPQMIPYSR